MHDVLAHRISLLSLHAGALEFHPDASPEEIARAAGVIRTSAHDALEDLRAVIGVLREGSDGAGPERPQPTLSDLPALIEESREAGMQVRFERELPDPGEVPVATGRSAYRIVQEGLTNARKHARGAAVEVTVAGTAGTGLTIEIRNRLPVGVAAASEIPGTGTGIVGLAERASLVGGRLEHGRTASGDYRLWVWLPWPP
jgi:signal transduction histidine kinase